MCNFLSVLIMRDGSIRHHPMLDSHSDLVTYFNLPDTNAFIPHFAKAELTPVDWVDPSTWKWRIDEAIRPIWLNDVESLAEAATRSIAQAMILKDVTKTLIIDDCWIVAGSSVIKDIRGGRILCVRDSAKISNVRDSAKISNVRDSAKISNVWGSAEISDVRDSAEISNVWDSAKISDVRDSAEISDVRGSAKISNVWGSAKISNVRDSAKISNVRGSAEISNVWDSAEISDVRGSAKLDESAKNHQV